MKIQEMLFAVQKCRGTEGSQDLGEEEIIRKWWHYMANIMEKNKDESPVSEPLKEVFHMEKRINENGIQYIGLRCDT